MITEKDLKKNFGGGDEYLFDVEYRVTLNGWGLVFRDLAYLIFPTEEENKNYPRLYMRFTEYRNQFELIRITKVTTENLHKYAKYEMHGMKCEIR